jgi:hypothetical protein
MQEAENIQASQGTFQESKRVFQSYPPVMSHFIDDKTPCLRKATREPVWTKAITEEYQYTLKHGT